MESEAKVDRRKYLAQVVGTGIAGLAVGFVGGYLTAPGKEVIKEVKVEVPVEKKWPEITFLGWAYRPDIVEDNVNFLRAYYGIPVTYETVSGAYSDAMTTKFVAGAPCDICYVRDSDVAGWVKAGWITGVEDMPGLDEYMDLLSPVCIFTASVEDRFVGLPYYSDYYCFVYNEVMFEEAGLTRPPKTWEEVTDYCLEIKRKGITEEPFQQCLMTEDYGLWGPYSMVFSMGDRLFDEDLNPLWEGNPEHGWQYMLQWHYDAINTHGILSTKSFEVEAVAMCKAMGEGIGGMGLFPRYNSTISILQGFYRRPTQEDSEWL